MCNTQELHALGSSWPKDKYARNPEHITSKDKDHRGVNLKDMSGTEIWSDKECKIWGMEGHNAKSILVPERPKLSPCVDNVRKSNSSIFGKHGQEATAPVPAKQQ